MNRLFDRFPAGRMHVLSAFRLISRHAEAGYFG
jgi:hypothetical protein